MPINIDHFRTVLNAMKANPDSKVNAWIEELEQLIPKHNWQWYFNMTVCTRCGQPIGYQGDCI